MDVNQIAANAINDTKSVYQAAAAKKTEKAEEKKNNKPEDAVAEEKDGVTAEISSSARKNQVYDRAQVDKILAETKDQNEAFVEMIRQMVTKQGDKFNISQMKSGVADFIKTLKPDAETVAWAKEQVSEDGYYGVKKTSERIMSFAVAVAGEDPTQLAAMRKAVQQGFGEAEKAWGSKLPTISQQTYDACMKKFDELESAANAKKAASGAAA